MQELTKKLEVSLGPDTADLALRVGLHSGPVTAGKSTKHCLISLLSRNSLFLLLLQILINSSNLFSLHSSGVLRGDNARFQLFGDTMNTTARIESNGLPNRIHCSQETADLLVASGKTHWVTERSTKITAKGKVCLGRTFFVIAKPLCLPFN